jgi:arsenical pump membrane protein
MTLPLTVLTWVIALTSIALMLLRPRGIAEAYWASGGALLLLATRLIPLHKGARAVREGWNVYLFLAGMMILAELAREEGVFEWLADVAAQHAKQSAWRLFALIYLVGTLVTAFLSNDATAVVLTPAVLAVVRKAKVEPKPYLLACAFIANAASFVFPISNPANLVVFDGHVPALVAWLKMFALPSLASLVATFVCLRWISHKELRGEFAGSVDRIRLSKEGKLALAGLLAAAGVLVASSAIGLSLGLPTCVAALLATALVAWSNRGILPRIAKGVSWSVLPLVAGLFVIVEALQNAELLRFGIAGLHALAQFSGLVAKLTAAFSVAFVSNGMNNLPVALMSGAAIQHAQESGAMAHAILIGVDLGPNLSVTGSLATILWLIALRREGVRITAWQFFKVGIIAMPVALIASLLFLWS